MAAANVTVKIDARGALAAIDGIARALWELRWFEETGMPWNLSAGKRRMADLDVTLGDRPWKTHVRIAGTALEVPCRNVTVTQDAGDIGWVRFEVPMSSITVKTAA